MSESSRNSHQFRRVSARRRSSQFSLEELSDDDVGYDADVEVVRPEYEDAESVNEDDAQDDDSSADSEDHLSHRLRGLYCDPTMVSSDAPKSPRKGRKRMSKDMEGGKLVSSVRNGRSDLEILELSVHTDDKHPAKRQRSSLTSFKTAQRSARSALEEHEGNGLKSTTDSSTLASSPSPSEDAPMSTSEKQDLEMTG
jgi:hypothetical protein